MQLVPAKENFKDGIRTIDYDIPEIAVREILANAIIHQDFSDAKSGPLVEVFPDRIVITSPGKALVPAERFLDAPSRCRNAVFNDAMASLGVCEKRGSGIDRAVDAIEKAGLPPHKAKIGDDFTVVTIFGPRKFGDFTKDERIWACYWHSCLCVERNEFMNNASLRKRFHVGEKQYPQVSEVIREAREAKLIKPLNEGQPNRNAKYVPH